MCKIVCGSLFLMLLLGQTAATTAQRVVPIWPTPGHEVSGQAIVDVTAAGDLVLEITIQGPQHEISRSEHADLGSNLIWPNLIWHVVEGTCDAWVGETADRGKVLYRFIEVPNNPDSLSFRMTVARVWLGQLDSRRLALAAFRNGGGGPLYACGDL